MARQIFDSTGQVIGWILSNSSELDVDVRTAEQAAQLQRSNSSSSGEEEIWKDGEMKKKKKDKKKSDYNKPTQEAEENKGKLPRIKKVEVLVSPPPTPAAAAEGASTQGADNKEKKG
ncbi:dehydrin ERD10-like [Salvia splendens]|uniref:dehydrin ERD10-like n=1 Tax=Salvia splendens TaxID=180675 RepID=UPI001C27E3DA|nr:dehydrin ERD10-like [Salvia splendens]